MIFLNDSFLFSLNLFSFCSEKGFLLLMDDKKRTCLHAAAHGHRRERSLQCVEALLQAGHPLSGSLFPFFFFFFFFLYYYQFLWTHLSN